MPPVTLDAAEHRLLAAAGAVADVEHAGERDPTRAEDQELLDAIAQYGDTRRAVRAAEQTSVLARVPTNDDGRAARVAPPVTTTEPGKRAGRRKR